MQSKPNSRPRLEELYPCRRRGPQQLDEQRVERFCMTAEDQSPWGSDSDEQPLWGSEDGFRLCRLCQLGCVGTGLDHERLPECFCRTADDQSPWGSDSEERPRLDELHSSRQRGPQQFDEQRVERGCMTADDESPWGSDGNKREHAAAEAVAQLAMPLGDVSVTYLAMSSGDAIVGARNASGAEP